MSDAFDLRLAGGTAVLPDDGARAADVLVKDGRIAAVLDPGEPGEATETLDCSGLHVLPGAVDPHVHLSQDISWPKTREDVEPETQAAAAGGVTTMLVYLLSPEPYDELIEPSKAAMDAHAAIDYGFHYCITTREQLERLPAYASEHGVSSFKYFMNFRGDEGAYLKLPGTDDGFLLDLLESAAAAGAMVDPHAENIELVWRLRDRGLVAEGAEPLAAWDRLRPGYVEAEALGRAAYLAQVAGASLYAVHTTNADSLRLLEQARERHPRVYVETCPHYLTLGTDSGIGTYGKVNPPLRSPADREALWEAIRSGLVDTIGSDHVPRQRSFKEQPLMKASAGFPGLQTLLPLMLSEGHLQRGIPLERIVDLVSTRPAELFGLGERKGAIRPGADADLVVVDLAASSRIEAATQLSGAGYTPWEGHPLGVTIRDTLVRGEFALRDGSIVPGARGRFLERPLSGAGAPGAAR
jgi:dihydropyrimidinase